MKLGAQLYTIRNFCKTPDGISESLARVADIGYTTVQISGTCDYDAAWLAQELKKNGLTCVLTHTKPETIQADPVAVCNGHKTFGCTNIGLGTIPGGDFSLAGYTAFVNEYLPIAKILKENGCKLAYHNHYREFWKHEDGKTVFEKLQQDFPVDLLNITLDTYWVQYAGDDPAAWIEKLAGRVDCIHLKDMAVVNQEQRMAPVGQGIINFDAVLKSAEKSEAKYLLVEQDHCYEQDPFDCLKRSYGYLASLGLN